MLLHLLVVSLAVCCFIAYTQAGHVKKGAMIPRQDFERMKRSPADAIHEVIIAVHQNNIDLLEQMVLERSTPGKPLYQKWMTFDEVGALITNNEAVASITEWLSSHSAKITWKSKRGEYIKATAPISVWENMFATEFHEWKDNYEGKSVLYHLAEHYSVPEEMIPHVQAVFNTVQVPPIIHTGRNIRHPNAFKTNLRVDLQSSSEVTVSYLNSYYRISSNLGNESLSQSVFETNNEYFSQTDLQAFQDNYGLTEQAALDVGGHMYTSNDCPDPSTPTPTAAPNSAPVSPSPSCTEGNLDIQYIMGVAQKVATIYWYVDNSGSTNVFTSYLTDVADEENPPQANSISWGTVEQTVSKDTMNSFNTEAIKLASMGVTVVVSSGDNGAVNSGCQSCTSSTDSSNCGCTASSSSSSTGTDWTGTSWSGSGYFPSFPATSPYVTAVGATMGGGGSVPDSGESEVVCMSNDDGVITSGGGFSTYYPRPSWQTAAVESYFDGLTDDDTPSAGYNPNGRGYPDISFIGVKYQVVIRNQLVSMYGTSASAPVFAAFVSLINSIRASNGLPSIGFLNPTLYSANYSSLYNDVTSGQNSCCAYPKQGICCDSGFTAASGWDPTTGWGSISFENFALMFNSTVGYDDDYDLPTPGVAASVVAVIVVVLVVGAVVAAAVWFFWCSCCNRQSSVQTPTPVPTIAMTDLPPQTAATHPQQPQNNFWACSACTLHNHNSVNRCSACGTARQAI